MSKIEISASKPLRSFGRVRGRKLRASKQTLMEALLPKITFTPESLPAYAEWWLEIGCGAGEHAAYQAEANPNVGYIACEPYVNGLSHLLQKIHDKNLKNVRIYAGDAREVIAALPADSLSRVFILFPDPWPKVRHWKRRLLTVEFFNSLTARMKAGARLRLATDHVDYLGWMLAHALATPALLWQANRHTDWDAQPEDAVVTRYQAKARAQGRVATYLDFVRT
jgi:tRNA (guanine-N7-)-methyltransferase